MFNLEYLRSFRLFGFAIFDFTISFFGVALLSPILSKIFRLIKLDIPFTSWMFFALPLSVLVHIIVGNYTPMTKDFVSLDSGFFIKFLIIGLFLLGARGIRFTR